MVVNLGFCQRVFVNTTRRIGYPLRLAWNRLVHGAGRAGLLALGIAAAAAALAAVIGGSLVAQDEALARALERVPPNERSVSVVYSDLGVTRNGVTREDLEPLVDRTLDGLAPGDPVRAVQLKLLRIGGQLSERSAPPTTSGASCGSRRGGCRRRARRSGARSSSSAAPAACRASRACAS